MDKMCFLYGLCKCLLPSQIDITHEKSLSLFLFVLFFTLLTCVMTYRCAPWASYWLDTFNPDICAVTTIPLFLPPAPPLCPSHSLCVAVWVLRGPIVSCCSPGAHSAAAGRQSLQSSPPPIKFPVLQDTDPPVPWASCRGGHSPIILPSKVATWRSVSGQARWLCAV